MDFIEDEVQLRYFDWRYLSTRVGASLGTTNKSASARFQSISVFLVRDAVSQAFKFSIMAKTPILASSYPLDSEFRHPPPQTPFALPP